MVNLLTTVTVALALYASVSDARTSKKKKTTTTKAAVNNAVGAQATNIFLDRESKIPRDLNQNNLDKFFNRQPLAFCQTQSQRGIAVADGTQNRAGSCSSTSQGSLPSFDKMVSTLIISPAQGATIFANVDNTLTLQNQGIQTGFFINPNTGYYIVPQTLDNSGAIEGHQHFVVQALSSTQSSPDPRVFAFFKGVNDAAGGDGKLSAVIPAGTLKTAGLHRICSITGSFAHQPVIMPVAQRGAQDDCIRVNVQLNGGNNNNNNANNNNNNANNNNANNNNANNNNANNNNAVSGNGKLGSCNAADAAIRVGVGADPANPNELRAVVSGKAPFTGQQSALNTAIVGNFICDRLNDQCGDKAIFNKCKGALGALPKGGNKNTFNKASARTFGAAIDNFNKNILGATTNFANTLPNSFAN